MIAFICVLLAFCGGFAISRYIYRPKRKKNTETSFYDKIVTIKETFAENKMTYEELEEERKANTFYN